MIRVRELRKAYGSVTAVDGISFHVEEGEIFGMVGPNGAGKTTTVECVEGLRTPDSGQLSVLGLDPQRDRHALLEVMGIQLQESALPPRLKVWEALDLFSSFYRNSANWTGLLERLGLESKRSTPFAKLSGGQKQRVFIALALVNDPQLVFLDEITTGLDPQARRDMWRLIEEIRGLGRTVFLTTHFMEEAERLCDRIAIVDGGRVVALDTPSALVRSLGTETRIIFSADDGLDAEMLRQIPTVSGVDRRGPQVVVCGSGDQLVREIVNQVSAAGGTIRDLRTEQATLEDVFLQLTGRSMED